MDRGAIVEVEKDGVVLVEVEKDKDVLVGEYLWSAAGR